MQDVWDGGCLCGAVRFEVTGAPYRVGVCHCLDCRKAQGTPFRFYAVYPADQVKLTGETAHYARASNDYEFYPLLDFYVAYHALVRAKIACLVARDPSTPAAKAELKASRKTKK